MTNTTESSGMTGVTAFAAKLTVQQPASTSAKAFTVNSRRHASFG